MGTRTLSKNIEDQTGTVQYSTLESALKVALLARRKHVVEDNQISLGGLDLITQLFNFATADQIFGRKPIARNTEERDGFSTGRDGQLLKLLRVPPRPPTLSPPH